ncbi:hypothetical protein MANES_07G095813v8 [Manihot esculenta]|uniref:Uncharacterized protein n=1 Tax=Manihot esculenta TaxID=3983 RepID=A0ACB7HHI2_MANES|nr:hypothetical protein MANES_07G095813v8 [Manihot esculenta]
MTILQLKGNYCVCKGHEKRITKVLSKNKGLFIKNLDLKNGFIHIDGDIDIEKLIKELQKKFKSMQVEVVEETDSDEEINSDNCESLSQPLENGDGYSASRLQWPDVGDQSRLRLRPYGGLNQLRYYGYGGFETPSTYGYGGQNYQIDNANYYNQVNDLTKIIRDENPSICSTM